MNNSRTKQPRAPWDLSLCLQASPLTVEDPVSSVGSLPEKVFQGGASPHCVGRYSQWLELQINVRKNILSLRLSERLGRGCPTNGEKGGGFGGGDDSVSLVRT